MPAKLSHIVRRRVFLREVREAESERAAGQAHRYEDIEELSAKLTD